MWVLSLRTFDLTFYHESLLYATSAKAKAASVSVIICSENFDTEPYAQEF